MEKIFGTDGIRGMANKAPLNAETAIKAGRAIAFFYSKTLYNKTGQPIKILIGKDTRISGDMLEHALAAGISSMGVDLELAGVLPTPGVAYLAAGDNFSAGIVISASHNPFFDNGIKLFNGDGYKLSDKDENEIEQLIFSKNPAKKSESIQNLGRIYPLLDAKKHYINFLTSTFPPHLSLKGIKIIIDCANGATSEVAPEIFSRLGADLKVIFANPDGKNINDQCGSQHPEILAEKVVENKAAIGLAFDGDGDRLIAVDENGMILTGDQLLAINARYLSESGKLSKNTVVSTVMSNLGLKTALKQMGITHIETNVGDRHVMHAMRKKGAILGGEDSGHMIFLDQHTTGDGILAGLRLIEVMISQGMPLSKLSNIMTIMPQILVNVEVACKPDISSIAEINDAVSAVEKKLGEQGRVLIRYSGTQPLCRVMVEGPTRYEAQDYCDELSGIIKKNLG